MLVELVGDGVLPGRVGANPGGRHDQHERVELRHLHGIASLLGFAEAEDVSHVRRARAIEEEFVFAEDDGAEGFQS